MNITPIRSDLDLQAALDRVGQLLEIDPAEGSPEHDELLVRAVLVETYEREHHPIEHPDPIAAVDFRMRERGLNQRQLADAVGTAESKISEVINKQRPLSISLIRRLSDMLDIPLEIMAQPYVLAPRAA